MKITKMLTDKYWKGVLSVMEEKWLREHYADQETKTPEAAYFQYLHEKAAEGIHDPAFDRAIIDTIKDAQVRQSRQFSWMTWRVAAAVILFLVASITFKIAFVGVNQPSDEVVAVDTYQDPEKALEETKKALLFISTQLNKGRVYTSEFSKFNESQEKLKKE